MSSSGVSLLSGFDISRLMISSVRSYSASFSIGRGSASDRSWPYFRTSSLRLVATVIFPRSFVIFLVRQHEASQDPFPGIKNLRDKPIVIAFDIEDSAGSHRIGVTEILSRFRQVIP